MPFGLTYGTFPKEETPNTEVLSKGTPTKVPPILGTPIRSYYFRA